MLHYTRRNATEPAPVQQGRSVHALVGFCNYSYDRRRHIDTSTLRTILSSFHESYIYLYLRLFNETNPTLLRSFMERENIEFSSVADIYRILQERGYDLRDLHSLL